MPLTKKDRKFLDAVDRLKIYVLLTAGAVLLYLLFLPSQQIQAATAVVGLTLCGVFWLTQRLLSFITRLDLELTRLMNALKHSLSDDQES